MGKPNVPRTCKQCGGPFMTWPSDIKRGQGRFCSLECAGRFNCHLGIGIPGVVGLSRSSLCKRSRKAWKAAHGGQEPACVVCGKQPADIDHRDGDRGNTDPDNLEAICRGHRIARENHFTPKRRKPNPFLLPGHDERLLARKPLLNIE